MTEPMDRAEESALWRHWRTAVVNAAGEAAPAPDPLLLAAYAEHRLSETAAEEVESWLALHPEAITDVLAAGEVNARPSAVEQPTAAALARAMALVPGADPKIVLFRRPAPRAATWRVTARRGAVAASLLVVSLVGFALGTDAYTSLLGGDQQAAVSQDLFDPPSGIFSGFGEDSSS
jgi:hypothetical protein